MCSFPSQILQVIDLMKSLYRSCLYLSIVY
nr:MAG TPA: hypothetical protein [Caudoviricetes sp.]